MCDRTANDLIPTCYCALYFYYRTVLSQYAATCTPLSEPGSKQVLDICNRFSLFDFLLGVLMRALP